MACDTAPRREIIALQAVPALSMVWPETTKALTREQVYRFIETGDLKGWTDGAMAEFVKCAAICDLGPEVDLEVLLTEFWDWIVHGHVLRLDRDTLLHEIALGFCVHRAEKYRWPLPATLKTRHSQAVLKLMGR